MTTTVWFFNFGLALRCAVTPVEARVAGQLAVHEVLRTIHVLSIVVIKLLVVYENANG